MRVTCKMKIVLAIVLALPMLSMAGKRELKVKLRGVYDSQIALSAHNGASFARPFMQVDSVKNGQEVIFVVPDSLLPGEFNLNFTYRVTQADQPYSAETPLFLNKEDILVRANPQYLKGDSLMIENDIENRVWNQFMQQSMQKQQQTGVLQKLLDSYTNTQSDLWKLALVEYTKTVQNYNKWVDSLAQTHNDLYIAHLFVFSKMLHVNFKLAPQERISNLGDIFFDNFNFNDTLALRSRQMNQFMSGYMAIYGNLSMTEALRDSLFTLAGDKACSMAANGHPLVYGWFVDYFYNGFETYNITPGLQMLEKHMANPNCLTTKKREIARRLLGIKNLVVGCKAPLLPIYNLEADQERILKWDAHDKDYQLVVFYETECGHCSDLLNELRTWIQNSNNSLWMNITSIALDNEQKTWDTATKLNDFPWTDVYAPTGVNSVAAANYYVLSTPNMFVIDKNGILQAMPTSIKELNKFLHGS
jgi:thioredoxin-related protein